MNWADGSEFKGKWHTDKRIEGTMVLFDGSEYIGPFKNEKFHGKGTLTLYDKGKITAVFNEGRCPKFAKVVYESGDQYTGDLK